MLKFLKTDRKILCQTQQRNISLTVKDKEIEGKQLKFNLNRKRNEIKNDYYKRKDYSTEVILKSLNFKDLKYY